KITAVPARLPRIICFVRQTGIATSTPAAAGTVAMNAIQPQLRSSTRRLVGTSYNGARRTSQAALPIRTAARSSCPRLWPAVRGDSRQGPGRGDDGEDRAQRDGS